jgi:general secretion pathway protein G
MSYHLQRTAPLSGQNTRTRRAPRATGFTMLEILVVLAIIGLLAGLAIVHVDTVHRQASVTATRLVVQQSLKTPLKTYQFNVGSPPTTAEGLRALLVNPGSNSRWQGPYIESAMNLVDPWGEPYQYEYPGRHNKDSFDLWSKGPDKQSGTADDITNWETSAAAPP